MTTEMINSKKERWRVYHAIVLYTLYSRRIYDCGFARPSFATANSGSIPTWSSFIRNG